MPLFRDPVYRRLAFSILLVATVPLAACEAEAPAPNETNTYNVHLYYGKDVAEHKYLGQVVGISSCKTAIHKRAAEMQLRPHTYTYVCCWLNAGDVCYQKHK